MRTGLGFISIAVIVFVFNFAFLSYSRPAPWNTHIFRYMPFTMNHSGPAGSKCQRLFQKEAFMSEDELAMGWPWVYWSLIPEPIYCYPDPYQQQYMQRPTIDFSEDYSTRLNYKDIKWTPLLKNLAIPNSAAFVFLIGFLLYRKRHSKKNGTITGFSFGLRTLFAIVLSVALCCFLVVLINRWSARCAIFHCKKDCMIEFPSGETFFTNQWHRPTHRLDNIMMLMTLSGPSHFLAEEEDKYVWGDPVVPIATIVIEGERFEAKLEKSAHYDAKFDRGCHEFWIAQGEKVLPNIVAAK